MLQFGNFPLWGRCRPPLYVWPRDIGPPPDPGLRKHAQKLEQDGGGRDAGDAAGVERRRDLDQIAPTKSWPPSSRIRRWASSVVRPPGSGVPVPGAYAGSSESIS